MRWTFYLPLMCALATGPALPAQAESLTPEAYASAKRAIVRLEISGLGPDGREDRHAGTGFLISDSGYVLTAHHNILFRSEVPYTSGRRIMAVASTGGGVAVEALVIKSDPELGLSLLRLTGKSDEALPFLPLCANPKPRAPARLYAFGFPDNQQFASRDGPFDSTDGLLGRWQTGISASPGMSGGPVTNEAGMVMGIMESGTGGPGERSSVTPVQWSMPLASIAFAKMTDCGSGGA
jgi:S1-C subfamily serine protease